ncbi:MAG: type phosphodiesterase/nucleotide pyrophosphatase [Gammaproteobacteria bacterium]|nr:type phosphodiesterase/nucleotide pyrophosphatase [Gammaproteobacteria bacterium]
MTHRVIMLGVDGLDWELVQDWSARGHLPVLRSLLEQSHALLLGKSNRPLPGSVWTDIGTGVSAAKHGFQHEEQLRLGSYQIEKVDASRVASEPFYETLSEAGVRCAVVDFPVDHPIEGFNGLQVVDWASEFKLWHFETRPRSLAAQLEARYGRHPLTHYPGTRGGLDNLLALKLDLMRGIDIKRHFCVELLQQRAHELIFFNFCELHKAGHFFWQFHDREHPQFTAAEPRLVDSLREMYEHMDRALGSVLQQLASDDDLILLTDRGMHADHRGDHLVDEILVKLGLAAHRGQSTSAASGSWRNRLLAARAARQAYRSVAQKLPHKVREALLPFHRAMIGAPAPWDWTRTQIFRLPSVGNSYLRVNLAGREPAGIVTPGDQYNALLAQIETQFRALVDPSTGDSVVEDVYFPTDHFHGPKSNELPDVAIVWSSRRPINAAKSDALGTVSGQQIVERSGNHRPEGFALFRGPSFGAGVRTSQGDARQIAPAILNVFGIQAPAHYDLAAPESILTSPLPRDARSNAPAPHSVQVA